MSLRIGGSVGNGGKNSSADVKIVQGLLNRFAPQVKLSALSLSGPADPQTIKFIKEFQKKVAGMTNADGLVDPNGPTWKKAIGHGRSGGKPRRRRQHHHRWKGKPTRARVMRKSKR